MTILGLDLEEWRDLLRIIFGVLLMTTALDIVGLFIHEGAHLFVALCLGCEVESFLITSFIGAGAELRIFCGPYLVPIAFAGAFAEGVYFLVVRRCVKSQWLWIATLSCWVYALAEVCWAYSPTEFPMAMPLITVTRLLTYVVVFVGLAHPRLKTVFDFLDYKDYQKASVDLSVWVPSDRRRNR